MIKKLRRRLTKSVARLKQTGKIDLRTVLGRRNGKWRFRGTAERRHCGGSRTKPAEKVNYGLKMQFGRRVNRRHCP